MRLHVLTEVITTFLIILRFLLSITIQAIEVLGHTLFEVFLFHAVLSFIHLINNPAHRLIPYMSGFSSTSGIARQPIPG